MLGLCVLCIKDLNSFKHRVIYIHVNYYGILTCLYLICAFLPKLYHAVIAQKGVTPYSKFELLVHRYMDITHKKTYSTH